ncbi:MAG: hypothetical protein GY832_14395, partial [Chloroflexi bacterium]|nr:hypothetical protein [Chloroflexota bacterium]
QDTDIAGLLITDHLPAEVAPIAMVWGAPYQVQPDGALTWGPLDLTAGESYTLAFTARVTESLNLQGSTVVNTATFSAPGFGSGVTPRATFKIALELVSFIYPDAGDVFSATNGVSATVPVRVDTPYTVLSDEGYWALWADGAVLASPILTHTTQISLLVGTHTLSATLHTTDTLLLATAIPVDIVVVSEMPLCYLPIVLRKAP